MSLMNMVAKVAVGYALAKGVSAVQRSGGVGKLMENLQAGAQGGALGSAAGGGGLAGILGQLTGGAPSAEQGGGLEQITGQLGANAGSGLGGIGGMLGGLAAARSGNDGAAGGLEALLQQDNPPQEPPEEQSAGLMIRAMISAARCDGELDAGERETLLATLGDGAGEAEMAVVRDAMAAPVSAQAIANDTPKGLETQVYSMSVMAIEPDNAAEANYLHELAGALGIGRETANEIHDSFGVTRLYS